MRTPIDLVHAGTAPFTATPTHALLAGFAGRYSGPSKLILDPSTPVEESTIDMVAESILGGRWLRLGYQGTAMGKPHAGEMLFGSPPDAGEVEMAWVDSFHTGLAIMPSRGRSNRGDAIDVLGGYGPPEQRWGWRTVLRRTSPAALVLEAYNITPQGEEMLAIEWRLARVE